MKIIGLVGSPRKNGNTDVLVQKALEGAKAQGRETGIAREHKQFLQTAYAIGKELADW
ncbi:MAG: NADPH-dependent reductase [Sporomusa sp.]|jgi:multimeric flavodoxin WrbA|nr:NADPH-dependent reductase [Sporomusa sp.]